MEIYKIYRRTISAKQYKLPVFRNESEKEQYYFINEMGVEQIAKTYKEAESLIEKNKQYFRRKKELNDYLKKV